MFCLTIDGITSHIETGGNYSPRPYCASVHKFDEGCVSVRFKVVRFSVV
jgi:hypothetical protein